MIEILLDLLKYEIEYDLFERDPGDLRYSYGVENNGRELNSAEVAKIDWDSNSFIVKIENETYRISVEKMNAGN